VKRILQLITGLERGGAEQLLAYTAPYLDRSRYEYEVAYLFSSLDALVGDLEKAGLPVHCLQATGGPGWIGRLRQLVRSREIDLVHVHLTRAAVGARLGLRGSSRPRIVYTEHGPWTHYTRDAYWGNVLTYPLNDYVFAVSDHVRESIVYPMPLRFRRVPPVETLYHGFDPTLVDGWEHAEGVREELNIPEGVPLIGTVANFRTQKRHDIFLKAVVLVRRALPDLRVVLVGDGPLEGVTRRLARNLELDGTVIFTGSRKDAPRIAASFDVFVLSSDWEGLSISLLEAMALGKSPVVTRVGGPLEIVEHEKSGLFVPPHDPEELAEAILTLLRDAPLRERLGEAARERASEFDIRRAVHREEELYEELLS
jgi:glycosyltransferase involved in cell wall biosynthesis